ncbi:GNAT family N-acetyltransferase [Caviibacter abscessus]|uniref:GNAT family N-acetyltransferase n=1 Tax=Caviibacter abscessus TaxID=1766719 RepID=UPI00082FD6D1|nr:GNAT family N-acetyltransferase [Caviibacter abscessus]
MVKITTKRLILRPFTLEDLDDFYEYAKVKGVGELAGWVHHKNKDESLEILKIFINSEEYAIVCKENNKVIGSVGVRDCSIYDNKFGKEIGYVLSKDYWGQGLMPEAINSIVEYYFKQFDIEYISCNAYKRNKQSQRVMEKAGFKYYKDTNLKTRYNTVEDAIITIKFNVYKNK